MDATAIRCFIPFW